MTMDSAMNERTQVRDAGDFETWLQRLIHSFTSGYGTNVPCGDCRACCSSGYFIPVSADETRTIAAIPPDALFHSPRHPTGDVLLVGLTKSGQCSLLKSKHCSIYGLRPQACRDYDCRLFAAAGIDSGIAAIDRTVKRWVFSYRSPQAWAAHSAIKAAASFLHTHRKEFPLGRCPARPDEVAISAIKAHRVFMGAGHADKSVGALVAEYITACRHFDTSGQIWGPPEMCFDQATATH